MRLIHAVDGMDETLTLVSDDSPAEDHIIPGWELVSDTVIERADGEEFDCTLPTETLFRKS